jgi:hypothetical protein
MYTKLSPHFDYKEVGCKDGTPYPPEWYNNRLIPLIEVAEVIRHACGDKPIEILSAFRTPSWNKKIGGAPNSQHLLGRALDLRPPEGISVSDFYKTIRGLTDTFVQIGGLGRYPTFVHVDIRRRSLANNRLATWTGYNLKDDQIIV